MLQSNHRNVSLVHSHIAVLQFAFFLLTQKTWRTKVYDKKTAGRFGFMESVRLSYVV